MRTRKNTTFSGMTRALSWHSRVWFAQIFQSSGHESPTEAIGVPSPHVGHQ
jgi:hypothetical protein